MSALTPAIRPYTSYNLFFQLEREYILQMLLGHTPALSPKEIFDPTDETNYQGPPLPPRYSNLVLLNDWHIPGKAQRRKRKHRRTHGKIGFHDLNERISLAWSTVDEQTRSFCATLANISSQKYKATKTDQKTEHDKEKKVTTKHTKEKALMVKSIKNEPKKVTSCFFPKEFTTGGTILQRDQGISLKIAFISRAVSHESFSEFQGGDSQSINNHDAKSVVAEVDMKDSEIYDIWDAIPIADNGAPTTKNGAKMHEPKVSIFDIDSEYKKFKDIGKKFLFERRLARKPVRASFTACQA